MPDSETEGKHFFRILGLFFQKVFRLQLFVSIVGLAEAAPAGYNGQLDLATPERRLTPGGAERRLTPGGAGAVDCAMLP